MSIAVGLLCLLRVKGFQSQTQRKVTFSLSKLHMSTKLILVRHGESTWNQENKFTGWYDCPLSEKGHKEAKQAGELLKKEGYKFDVAYTSFLQRAIRTLWYSLEETHHMYIPVIKSWRLNERFILYPLLSILFDFDFFFVI
jgi:hypothetical protein